MRYKNERPKKNPVLYQPYFSCTFTVDFFMYLFVMVIKTCSLAIAGWLIYIKFYLTLNVSSKHNIDFFLIMTVNQDVQTFLMYL